MKISQKLKNHLIEKGLAQSTWTDPDMFARAASKAIEAGEISAEKVAELLDTKSPADVFGNVRLKKPSERYSTTKSVGKHVRSGLPVKDERGREVQTSSQLEHAKSGALLKKIASRSGLPCSLNEHEMGLLEECFEDDWCGKIDGEFKSGIQGSRVKALINDGTSGGSELVPEWFDSNIITFPLLHSEILPKVDLVEVPRGASVEGASVNTPTANWGTNEGTSVGLFDTGSMVAGLDTTIHPVTIAVEIGRDLMADSVVDIGRILTQVIGERMLSELDRVICTGNGNTEPTGIFSDFSGMSDIGNPTGGDGQDIQVDDLEALLFAVPKQYRNANMRPCFLANDTYFARARGIPVGSGDERRVFGMTHEDYMILHRPFLINNDLANNVAAFGAMNRYRLFRRQNSSVSFTTEGRELNLKNLALLIVRGRYGGKVVDPNGFSYGDNFKA